MGGKASRGVGMGNAQNGRDPSTWAATYHMDSGRFLNQPGDSSCTESYDVVALRQAAGHATNHPVVEDGPCDPAYTANGTDLANHYYTTFLAPGTATPVGMIYD